MSVGDVVAALLVVTVHEDARVVATPKGIIINCYCWAVDSILGLSYLSLSLKSLSGSYSSR